MLIATNKMQRNTVFFVAVKAVHVSGGFPAHHQELKNCTCSIWYLLSLVAAIAATKLNKNILTIHGPMNIKTVI
jgi:hypothetical protein